MPWLALVLVVLVAIAYHNSLRGPFIWDDLPHILENHRIRTLGLEAVGGTSRPLVLYTFAINYALGRLDVFGYHLLNLVIHTLAALALFAVVRTALQAPRLADRFGRHAPLLAVTVSAIWAVHPIQTESVTYMVQRAESLAGLFYLLLILCVLRGARSSRPVAWFAAAVACSLLGLASKPVMATAPLVALLCDRALIAGSFRQALSRRWPLYVALLASLALLPLLLARGPGDWAVSAGLGQKAHTPTEYAITQLAVVPQYLRLAFWPTLLVLDYAWPSAPGLTSVLPGALIIGVLLALTGWAVARNLTLGCLGAWFFIALAPTSSVFPIADAAFEHRMYVPMAPLVAAVVIGLYALTDRLRPRRAGRELGALALVVVVLLTSGTIHRNHDYRSVVAIWSDNIAKHPVNPRPYVQLGNAYGQAERFEEARQAFAEAVRLKPDYGVAVGNLGRTLEALGREEEAVQHYARALELDPKLKWIRYKMGMAMLRHGRITDAQSHLEELVRRYPEFVDGRNGLGHVLRLQGRNAEAAAQFRAVLAIDPSNPFAREALDGLRRGEIPPGP